MSGVARWFQARSPRTRRLLAIGLVAAVGVAGYRGWAAARAEGRFREAQSAADRGDLPAARNSFDECLSYDPASGRFLFHAARAARRDGDFSAAKKLLDLARAAGWPGEAVEWERSLAQAQTGQFAAAASRLRTAVEAEPDHPDADLLREVLVPGYIAGFHLTDAYQILVDWIERRPDDLRLRLWMFDVARRQMRPDQTLESARRAVAIAPDNPDARAICADILIENHQAAEAKPHCEWLLAHNSENPSAKLGLAKCLRELGDGEGAIRLVGELLGNYPDRPEYLAEMGTAELAAGRPQAARDWLRRAAKADPTMLGLAYNYSLCLEQCGQPDEAKQWRERSARSEADLNELKDATKRIAADPRNADLRFRAGELMMRNGYDAEGLRWLRSALAENPNHAPSRKALDEYYSRIRREIAAGN